MSKRYRGVRPYLLSLLSLSLLTAIIPAHAAAARAFTDADRRAVKDVFLRQAAAATAHDIVAFERVLATAPAGQPDPIAFVAHAYQFWGKPALIEHFKETFKGVWKFEPKVASINIIPLTPDVAELYAPTQITLGASEGSARTAPFLVYEVVVRTAQGWRIASIVPVAAQ
jgi:ketosteroid isomerase-like protein